MVGIILSSYEPSKVEKGQKKIKKNVPDVMKDETFLITSFSTRSSLKKAWRTLDARDLKRRLRSRHSHSISGSLKRNPNVFSKIRRDRSESPRHRPEGRRDGGVFNRLGGKGKSVSAHSEIRYHIHHSKRTDLALKRRYHEGTSSRDTKAFSKSEDSRGGHWKSRSKKAKSSIKEAELS
ncbi:hypothetical protein Tco_0001787 [Tanacetum coccineum]